MDQSHSGFVDFFLKHQPCSYKKGEIVVSHDEDPVVCYLTKGYVRVYRLLPNGAQSIYVFYKAGEIFPIVWTFRKENRHLFYEAMSDVTVYRVSRNEFLQFIENKPALLFEIIHRIVDRHSVYLDRVDNLVYTNGGMRIIAALLDLAKRFGTPYQQGILIEIPITHEDIANSIAMTRETASRDIEELQEKDLVKRYHGLLFLPDIKRLQEELENSS